MQVRRPGVFVPDGSAEEFEEAARGGVAGVGDDRRDDNVFRDRGDGTRRSDDGQLWL